MGRGGGKGGGMSWGGRLSAHTRGPHDTLTFDALNIAVQVHPRPWDLGIPFLSSPQTWDLGTSLGTLHLCKHYLPATSLAGGNNIFNQTSFLWAIQTWEKLSQQNILHSYSTKRKKYPPVRLKVGKMNKKKKEKTYEAKRKISSNETLLTRIVLIIPHYVHGCCITIKYIYTCNTLRMISMASCHICYIISVHDCLDR